MSADKKSFVMTPEAFLKVEEENARLRAQVAKLEAAAAAMRVVVEKVAVPEDEPAWPALTRLDFKDACAALLPDAGRKVLDVVTTSDIQERCAREVEAQPEHGSAKLQRTLDAAAIRKMRV